MVQSGDRAATGPPPPCPPSENYTDVWTDLQLHKRRSVPSLCGRYLLLTLNYGALPFGGKSAEPYGTERIKKQSLEACDERPHFWTKDAVSVGLCLSAGFCQSSLKLHTVPTMRHERVC